MIVRTIDLSAFTESVEMFFRIEIEKRFPEKSEMNQYCNTRNKEAVDDKKGLRRITATKEAFIEIS